ncbi:restriction endonuclease subunit S [Clostridium perfringens]|nr:restriction endonuclease subunit S [Clostridium perfringens]ELC8390101.1 restriction endonuclease subunit S [Clostridium perfringens]ELC8433848.1 restriction endonuclease subunit S [Clostridium perfringens]MBI6101767.1 restriction endonuclease subunit S [Clostridium perfringens]QPS25370.1 restriction endonuclease subunit S [Clostridium perfringens]UBK28730.1 restriction endonuclease subunit S [Clostridium perfringens]
MEVKKEVREGYKMTELGEIPSEWKILRLDELANIKRGASPRPISDSKWFTNEKNVGWIRISDVTNTKKFLNTTEQYLSEEGIAKSRIVNKGDLIMSICATVGKPIILNMLACIHDGFVLFDNLNNNLINTQYLFYLLQKKEEEFKNMGQIGTQANLNTNIVGRTVISLPRLNEQEKIVEILSTVDKQIENTEKLIQKNQELKKGLMQQLLTKGIGHKEFKETELGEIPKEWEVKKIGEISDFCSNGFVGTATPYYSEKGTFYLMSNNVRENKIDTRNMIKVNDKFVSLYPRSKIYKDDMLTVQSGHIGTSCVVTQEYDNCNCHALIITRFKKRFVDSNFISYYLNSDKGKDRLSSIFVGSTIKHINVKDLVKFFVPVPEIYEQRKIVSILSSLDGKIEQYRNKKEKLEEMKKGLMQQLLKGKIRVV